MGSEGTFQTSGLILWLYGAAGTDLSRRPGDQLVSDDTGEPLSSPFRKEPVGRRAVSDSLQLLCCTMLSPCCSQPTLEHGSGTGAGHFCPRWDPLVRLPVAMQRFSQNCSTSEALATPSPFPLLFPPKCQTCILVCRLSLPPPAPLPLTLSTGMSPNKSLSLQILSWCLLPGWPKLTQIQNTLGQKVSGKDSSRR